jgi:phosphatidylserine decarboxylase
LSALTFAAAQLLRVLPRRKISRAMGMLADHRWSPPVERAVVGLYSRVYRVDTAECDRQDGYENFDEFFTRTLRAGARPIDTAREAIVSPADGRLDSMGSIDATATFTVKGRPYRVGELLGDEEEARRYVGGVGCVIYLSPRDYHRVHAPVDGVVAHVRSMPGDYYPVNSIGMSHVGNLFAINRRVSIAIDTPTLGRVAVVMVAAIVVGRITVSAMEDHDVPHGVHPFGQAKWTVARGDEIGIFHLGSTVVLLVEPTAKARWAVSAGATRFGSRIATASLHENGTVAARYT